MAAVFTALTCLRLKLRCIKIKSMAVKVNKNAAAINGPLGPFMPWLNTDAI